PQILSNVLQNAFKYTPKSGKINLAVERAGNQVVIRIRDSGIGIRLDLLPRIFNIYFQGDPIPGSELQGLGIGLALARQLTVMHAGSIEAVSDGSGKGSEFVIRLPLASGASKDEASHDGASAASAPEAGKVPMRKVLIVDDNRDAAEALSLLLTGKGHQTRVAHDGDEALQIVSGFTPEIAIVD